MKFKTHCLFETEDLSSESSKENSLFLVVRFLDFNYYKKAEVVQIEKKCYLH